MGRDPLGAEEFPYGPATPAEAGPGAPRSPDPLGALWVDFHAVFARSPVGMAVVDPMGTVLLANAALGALLGHDPELLPGKPLHEHAAADDVGRVRPGIAERRLRHQRGHDVWTLVSAVPLPEVGEGALLVVVDDATARHNTERMLLHAALHDSLTNLPNRRLLRDRLDTALARAQRSLNTVAVLFLDLDHFKDVNDTYGHDVGDEVLISVAAGIHAAMRSCDTVARLGGDEFVVVCEDVREDDDVRVLAERILEGVRRPLRVQGHHLAVAGSIGIAVAQPGLESADELLRRADLAMYRAKHRAAGSYEVAVSGRTDEIVLPLALGTAATAEPAADLLDDLRHAIQSDQLQLHYQPVVRVDGGLVGLEALLRWQHPRLGMLLPGDFLDKVAGTELAKSVGDWVLRAAVRDAASWHDPNVRVSVNVWATEVARPGFADTVAMLLTWAGLQARALYLELHETELGEAGPGLVEELDKLRRLGVGLAIDDYGTGGMSLAALRRLPVDTLKLDRSVVAGVLGNDAGVVAAVAAAARAAGRRPLAAGVETVEQLHRLAELGYESVQGYVAGAPAPLVDLREVIRHRRVPLG